MGNSGLRVPVPLFLVAFVLMVARWLLLIQILQLYSREGEDGKTEAKCTCQLCLFFFFNVENNCFPRSTTRGASANSALAPQLWGVSMRVMQ